MYVYHIRVGNLHQLLIQLPWWIMEKLRRVWPPGEGYVGTVAEWRDSRWRNKWLWSHNGHKSQEHPKLTHAERNKSAWYLSYATMYTPSYCLHFVCMQATYVQKKASTATCVQASGHCDCGWRSWHNDILYSVLNIAGEIFMSSLLLLLLYASLFTFIHVCMLFYNSVLLVLHWVLDVTTGGVVMFTTKK